MRVQGFLSAALGFSIPGRDLLLSLPVVAVSARVSPLRGAGRRTSPETIAVDLCAAVSIGELPICRLAGRCSLSAPVEPGSYRSRDRTAVLSCLFVLVPTAANQKELCITAQLHSAWGGGRTNCTVLIKTLLTSFFFFSVRVYTNRCRVWSTQGVCGCDFREG